MSRWKPPRGVPRRPIAPGLPLCDLYIGSDCEKSRDGTHRCGLMGEHTCHRCGCGWWAPMNVEATDGR